MTRGREEEGAKFVRFFGPLLDALRSLGGSAEARREATRDGAPPIELIDGEKLIDMLEKLELGLRPVTTFEVERSFFKEFGSE